ncbi:unnamed protein product [Thlaspi arvense]|uniref:EF-hand domain-containing protein n=1 Tax=Thlaspi arvense TaxID=13288 RepID=A0AAU9RUU4_THLAR|nr:unnamed protein product [Thlaspi arvense]
MYLPLPLIGLQFLFTSAHASAQPLFQQTCEQSFSHYDVYGDGYISIQKLGDALKHRIPNLNKYEIQGMYISLDEDKDQRISKNDLLSSLRKNPLLIAIFPIESTNTDLLICRTCTKLKNWSYIHDRLLWGYS